MIGRRVALLSGPTVHSHTVSLYTAVTNMRSSSCVVQWFISSHFFPNSRVSNVKQLHFTALRALVKKGEFPN